MTKTLYQPRTTGISIKDILQGDQKNRRNTAYSQDYRDFAHYEKVNRIPLTSLKQPIPPPSLAAALKYKRWNDK